MGMKRKVGKIENNIGEQKKVKYNRGEMIFGTICNLIRKKLANKNVKVHNIYSAKALVHIVLYHTHLCIRLPILYKL